MNLDCVKRGMSDYDFLKLFSATTVIQNQNIVFENDKLKKGLYKYSNEGKFRHLFFDLNVSDEKKSVDLSEAIEYGYTFGLLTKLDDSKDMSMISYNEKEAKEEISKYSESDVIAMDYLCSMYYAEQIKDIKNLKK